MPGWRGRTVTASGAAVLYSCCMGSLTGSPASDWVDYSPRRVLGCTLMRAHFDVHRFERHSHESYSIGLTTSGVQSFHCGGTLHSSLPGDLILFNPDQAHDGSKGAPEGFAYTILHLPVETVTSSQDRDAGVSLPRHFKFPLARDRPLARAFEITIAALRQVGEMLRAEELLAALVTDGLVRQGENGQVRLDASAAGAVRMNATRDYLAANFH